MNYNVSDFKFALHNLGIEDNGLSSKFEELLLKGGTPESQFEYIAAGAFKECYELCNGWIIKFATEENRSQKEMEVLAAAEEAGVDMFFLNTFYNDIEHTTLLSYNIDEAYSYYYYERDEDGYPKYHYNYTQHELVGYFIQPRIDTTADYGPYVKWFEEDYLMGNDFVRDANGELVPHALLRHSHIDNINWLQDAINYYGMEMFTKLADFVHEENLHDLHPNNLGYIDGRPVIIDWLS